MIIHVEHVETGRAADPRSPPLLTAAARKKVASLVVVCTVITKIEYGKASACTVGIKTDYGKTSACTVGIKIECDKTSTSFAIFEIDSGKSKEVLWGSDPHSTSPSPLSPNLSALVRNLRHFSGATFAAARGMILFNAEPLRR